jgi:predicted nucleotidyltransferase
MYFILYMLEKYATIKAIQKVASQPNRAFSVRGLAAAAAISPGASRIALEYMKKKGIVSLTTIGRSHQFKANLESPLCRQWKILFNLDLLEDSKIVSALRQRIPSTVSILLFGSFAKGTNDEKSDIDILVVSQKPANIDLGFASKAFREANISIMPMRDWKKKAAVDKVFYENVVFDSIMLFGERPVVL